MKWNLHDADEQVKCLLRTYPKLNLVERTDKRIILSGTIDVYRTSRNYTVQKEYSLEINVPLGNDDLPIVRETGNAISEDYPHRYKDGGLCIETDTAIRLHFIDSFNLVEWMDEFVEPYFFSYEYFSRFGEFPFGERPHYIVGILDTYQEIFHATDSKEACRLLVYAAEDIYRGHAPCPCGSGRRLRNCHGKYLLPFMTDKRKKAIAFSDLQYLRKELKSFE